MKLDHDVLVQPATWCDVILMRSFHTAQLKLHNVNHVVVVVQIAHWTPASDLRRRELSEVVV